MHSASVPVFKRQLGAVLSWLDKAVAHAAARKFDSVNWLPMRLAPDMLPFVGTRAWPTSSLPPEVIARNPE